MMNLPLFCNILFLTRLWKLLMNVRRRRRRRRQSQCEKVAQRGTWATSSQDKMAIVDFKKCTVEDWNEIERKKTFSSSPLCLWIWPVTRPRVPIFRALAMKIYKHIYMIVSSKIIIIMTCPSFVSLWFLFLLMYDEVIDLTYYIYFFLYSIGSPLNASLLSDATYNFVIVIFFLLIMAKQKYC